MSQTGVREAFANLRQRNQFATLTSISLAALLWLAASGRFAGRGQWLVGLAAGNAASSSRTGLKQLGLLGALWGMWGGLAPTDAAPSAAGGAGPTLPWPAGLDFSAQGAFARLRAGGSLWSNVLHLIAQKPWL